MKYRYFIIGCALVQLCSPVNAQDVTDTTAVQIAY